MCLEVRHLHIRKAKKDIVCYKVLYKNGNTPFMNTPFRETPKEDININWGIPYYSTIKEGYIHAYKNCEYFGKAFVTHKAIIPKGTKYWYGIDSYGKEGYASKCIKLIK